jgi:hypothetical protein
MKRWVRRLSASGMTGPELGRQDPAKRPLIERIITVVRQRGLTGLARVAVSETTAPLRYHPLILATLYCPWLRWHRRDWRFSIGGRIYRYFYHWYNTTWRVERAVEIPPAVRAIRHCSKKRILEIGNVLAHYAAVSHDVLDKYEDAPRVIRADAADYTASQRYDLIISISTAEHIGWDEQPRQPQRALQTLEHLHMLLAPGGGMLVSAPLGYNAALDEALLKGQLPFDRVHCLRRISADNRWEETTPVLAATCRYGEPWNGASAVWFGCVGNVLFDQDDPGP